jgi:Domain of unknown function (DUF6089)
MLITGLGYFNTFVFALIALVMRKLSFVALSIALLVGSISESYAQFNARSIKKTNKRIAHYRGKKSGFSKSNIYSGIGISINALNYFGDLSPSASKLSTDLSFTKPGFGLSFFHRFGPRYTLMAQYMYGTIKGSDVESAALGSAESEPRNIRNLSFSNSIHELSVLAYIDLFENQATYISRVKWTPYIYTGGTLFAHNPQAIAPQKDLTGNALAEAGQYVDLQPLKTEGQSYSLIQFAIPFGAGARFKINEVMDLWADFGFRYTFTDYLDDVSNTYTDLTKLSPLGQALSYRTNELGANGIAPPRPANGVLPSGITTVDVQYGYGREGDKRGGANQNDIYMVTSIRLTYILGATFHKAKFR